MAWEGAPWAQVWVLSGREWAWVVGQTDLGTHRGPGTKIRIGILVLRIDKWDTERVMERVMGRVMGRVMERVTEMVMGIPTTHIVLMGEYRAYQAAVMEWSQGEGKFR